MREELLRILAVDSNPLAVARWSRRWPSQGEGIEADDGGRVRCAAAHLVEFVVGGSEADFEAVDLAGPAAVVCIAESGDQVVADLGETWQLRCPCLQCFVARTPPGWPLTYWI